LKQTKRKRNGSVGTSIVAIVAEVGAAETLAQGVAATAGAVDEAAMIDRLSKAVAEEALAVAGRVFAAVAIDLDHHHDTGRIAAAETLTSRGAGEEAGEEMESADVP
jgi:uncharacterized phage protein gp47/JayE